MHTCPMCAAAGTRVYMPPEAHPPAKAVSAAGDLYALGLSCWVALHRYPPFAASEDAAQLSKHSLQRAKVCLLPCSCCCLPVLLRHASVCLVLSHRCDAMTCAGSPHARNLPPQASVCLACAS